jgi:hypothetical protein
MIAELRRWERRLVDGAVEMVPPAGDWAWLRVEDEVGLASPGPVPDGATLLVTDEGEHATRVVRVDGERQLVVIVIDGDVARRRITAAAQGRGRFAVVAAIADWVARRSRLGLGAVRRRRVRCAAPAGWTRRDVGLAVQHLRDGSILTVLPARPLGEIRAGADLETLLVGTLVGGVAFGPGAQRHGVLACDGLRGEIISNRVGDGWLESALLLDDRFGYALVLHGRSAGDREAFRATVASVRAIPRGPHLAASGTALDHWI